jgi:outer membrane lipopolysaccharide assembly protein LptE/RlpB
MGDPSPVLEQLPEPEIIVAELERLDAEQRLLRRMLRVSRERKDEQAKNQWEQQEGRRHAQA